MLKTTSVVAYAGETSKLKTKVSLLVFSSVVAFGLETLIVKLCSPGLKLL